MNGLAVRDLTTGERNDHWSRYRNIIKVPCVITTLCTVLIFAIGAGLAAAIYGFYTLVSNHSISSDMQRFSSLPTV